VNVSVLRYLLCPSNCWQVSFLIYLPMLVQLSAESVESVDSHRRHLAVATLLSSAFATDDFQSLSAVAVASRLLPAFLRIGRTSLSAVSGITDVRFYNRLNLIGGVFSEQLPFRRHTPVDALFSSRRGKLAKLSDVQHTPSFPPYEYQT